MDEYLTINQISKILKINRKTIEYWLHSGKLRGLKFGKQWRIKRSDVEIMGEPNGQD